MKQLSQLLSRASKAYHNENREIMTDLEYDSLYDELASLESQTGIILAGSPTQSVGYEVLGSLEKVRHDSPMLSLDKTKSTEKLQAFLGSQTGLLSWKLDGLTIVLRYSGGKLIQAVTRGNGEIGEDVTHNAKVFKNIPLGIRYAGELVARGEAVIDYASFNQINETLPPDEKYKNPRNLCSGAVRQLNSETAASRSVSFFVFTLVKADGEDFGDSKSKQLEWLSEEGFEVVPSKIATQESVESDVSAFASKIADNPYASDGLVLTYDSLRYSASLGATSKFPKDSIAFKWADEMSETKLIDIEWSTSRTGLINPVAVFEPVEIEGSTVNKASVHNVSVLQSLALGIGDVIKVYKANMIIPQIAENLTRSGPEAIPETCPVCGAQAEIIGLKEGKALFCTNPGCKAQLVRGLSHFASRDAMNIDGLSQQTLEKFVQKGFIQDFADLYEISRYEQEIVAVDGFGQKSYNNLIDSLEKSKTVNLANFIYALGINQVGLSNAKLLCGYYDNDVEKIIQANPDELSEIEGFGEVISKSVSSYFSDEGNIQRIRRLLPQLNLIQQAKADADQTLAGLSFAITGELQAFPSRKKLQDAIESLGGKTASSVTGKTSFLVNNDSMSESAKNKKAKQFKIPILTEQELISRFPEIGAALQ
ncbi:MAG: NAD-dependent DNA ligase LigA [Clostridiales bacterium]|nr:NAD-dependent DNA ligase LigA [Clostridiales bacterium]